MELLAPSIAAVIIASISAYTVIRITIYNHRHADIMRIENDAVEALKISRDMRAEISEIKDQVQRMSIKNGFKIKE